MTYLLRDDQSNDGYVTINQRPPDLGNARDNAKALAPWALTSDHKVVYATWDSLRNRAMTAPTEGMLTLEQMKPKRSQALRLYDATVSQDRRREFETVLTKQVEKNPECVMPAVNVVSEGIRSYYQDLLAGKGQPSPGQANSAEQVKDILDKVLGDFCYGTGWSAQLGTSEHFNATDRDEHIEAALKGLEGTDIARIMTVQSAFAFKFAALGATDRNEKGESAQEMRFNDCASKVTPKDPNSHLYNWFGKDKSGKSTRGRITGDSNTLQGTKLPGILRPGQAIPQDLKDDLLSTDREELHKRGQDLHKPDESSAYVGGLKMRNLVFGAGRSGSTECHLEAYKLFAGIDDGESFKQYLLATVVTLVGKGHHTCHEVFCIANLLSGPYLPMLGGKTEKAEYATTSEIVHNAYVPGSYSKFLPNSFTSAAFFEQLRERYYDILVLGHLHGSLGKMT